MVIIAYNKSGKVVSIVNARSEELAIAFWHGQKLDYDTHSRLDDTAVFEPIETHVTGVYPILQTITITAGSMRHDAKVLCIK